MQETEITVQVFNSFEETDKELKNQGFEMIENYKLNDWYFSKLENIQNVPYIDLMDNSFLVRQVLTDSEKIKLCYKHKKLDDFGNVIAEEKTNTYLSSLADAIEIFKKAGLNNYCVVKNDSYVYKKGNIAFVVQVIENLGIFIEYEEDETMEGMSNTQKIEHMKKIIDSLGLKLGQDYSCKKVFMLLKNHFQYNKS